MTIKSIFLLCLLGASLSRLPNLDITKSYTIEPTSCPQSYFMKFIPEGYPVEQHEILTDDGFKLNIFRIQAKGSRMKPGLHPVLIQHGLDDSALTWLINSEQKSIPFILANQGYDVWLGNNRGNKFSREHIKYTQSQTAFWDFSFQDMGQFDVPSTINIIRQESGASKITIIGHSQGTSQMFAALSDPVVRHKVAPFVDTFHAFAPVVYLSSTELMTFKLAKWFSWALNLASSLFHLTHFKLGKCDFDESTIAKFQKECSISKCDYFKDTDPHPETVNYEAYGWETNTHPAGISMKCIVHYAQFINQDKIKPAFRKFDYGSKAKNMEKYGQADAPMFPLEDITNRVVLYLGDSDTVADFADSSSIAAKLTNAQVEVKTMRNWGHMSFVMPINGDVFYSSIGKDINMRLNAHK